MVGSHSTTVTPMNICRKSREVAASPQPGADPESSAGGGELRRVRERKPIWGSGGLPRGVQGQSPWSGGQSPREADAFL